MLSKAAKTHSLSNEYDKIFSMIVNILNTNYLNSEKISDEKLEYFPDYIKCCSSLMGNSEITEDYIILLQRVSVLMVKCYPKISSVYHELISESIIISFANIYQSNEDLFTIFIQRFICEAVIWSCDCEPINTIEESNGISYKSYLPLWKNLTNINNNIYLKHNIAADIKKTIVTKIFDELIIRLMVSTSKLNLKLKNTKNDNIDDEFPPENPNDYIIFINMVDLYNSILESCSFDLFRKWIKRFSKHVIERSLNNPIVSGYYKLLTRCLKISNFLNYFDDVKQKEDKLNTFKMIENFLEGIISKIQQFKGDLQLSCLNLIFAAPIAFIRNLLPALTPVFQVCSVFFYS